MYKKWKSVAALGMAVLIGCTMPVSTMMAAAEENPEAEDTETQANTAEPVIVIKWQGESCITYNLNDEIDYKYINNRDQAFECSASQDGQPISFSYYLDKTEGTTIKAKGIGEITSWTEGSPSSMRIPFEKDKDAIYVLYVKAEAGGQTTYARSKGIVVDTIAPGVTKLVDGGTYPEGTTFQVSETNLESVKVNEVLVNPESDGSYRVSANGTSTSCVVKVKDKAGNETTYSITISKDPAEDGIISKSGTYSLKANVKYQLGEGQWQAGGDKSVYSGGSTFYVKEDGDYKFTKR